MFVTTVFSDVDVPSAKAQVTTLTIGNSVYYGNYIQDKVVNKDELDALEGYKFTNYRLNVDGIGYVLKDGKVYKDTPIEWQILYDEGDCYALISKKVLEIRPFDDTIVGTIFWHNSQLREWLNGTFFNDAFSRDEQNDIETTTLSNITSEWGTGDNPYYPEGDPQEVITEDKVYLLTSSDVQNSKFGFVEGTNASELRVAHKTQYLDEEEGATSYWLRESLWSYGVQKGDLVYGDGSLGSWYRTWSYGIRPVIRVKKNAKGLSATKPAERGIVKKTDENNFINNKIVTGKYRDGQLEKVFSDTESYSDSYFTKSSTKVQGGLAKLSMLAASSAYNKEYAEKLMESCEFSIHNYKKKKPTKKKNDTISYEIGIRKVNDITIIAVWIKGTSGDYEWVSNWNLGKGKTHAGFSKAEKTMNNEINSYLKSKKINLTNSGKIKIWITGHSRGAAVANLYAKRMNGIVGCPNVYAYTFATPRVSKLGKQAGYKNIFNYLNLGDFVTEVAPKKWGYKRYGKDITMPKAKKKNMAKMFKRISGKKYNGFDEKGKKSLLKAFIKYAGSSNKDYYRKQYNTPVAAIGYSISSNKNYKKNKIGYAPSYFCQNGLGYILAKKVIKGLNNCLKVCNVNGNATTVFGKMIIDGKVNKKFGYAHTQLGYLSWLKQMY